MKYTDRQQQAVEESIARIQRLGYEVTPAHILEIGGIVQGFANNMPMSDLVAHTVGHFYNQFLGGEKEPTFMQYSGKEQMEWLVQHILDTLGARYTITYEITEEVERRVKAYLYEQQHPMLIAKVAVDEVDDLIFKNTQVVENGLYDIEENKHYPYPPMQACDNTLKTAYAYHPHASISGHSVYQGPESVHSPGKTIGELQKVTYPIYGLGSPDPIAFMHALHDSVSVHHSFVPPDYPKMNAVEASAIRAINYALGKRNRLYLDQKETKIILADIRASINQATPDDYAVRTIELRDQKPMQETGVVTGVSMDSKEFDALTQINTELTQWGQAYMDENERDLVLAMIRDPYKGFSLRELVSHIKTRRSENQLHDSIAERRRWEEGAAGTCMNAEATEGASAADEPEKKYYTKTYTAFGGSDAQFIVNQKCIGEVNGIWWNQLLRQLKADEKRVSGQVELTMFSYEPLREVLKRDRTTMNILYRNEYGQAAWTHFTNPVFEEVEGGIGVDTIIPTYIYKFTADDVELREWPEGEFFMDEKGDYNPMLDAE